MKNIDIAGGMTGGTCVPTPAPQRTAGLPLPYASSTDATRLRTTGVVRIRERSAGFGTALPVFGPTGPGAHPV